jgi:mannitol-1-phosphate 5-dehydrogenase
MKNPTAVVFGAGKMACGLLGQLLAQSGFEIVFVARRPEVIDAINQRQGYTLTLTRESTDHLAIRKCRALSIHDEPAVAGAVANADVVFTAVGIDNLTAITPAIARGLWQRSLLRGRSRLNVIACENLPGAGAYLRHQVVSAAPLPHETAVERIGGFSAGLTRRIMTGGAISDGELTFTANVEYDLLIDVVGLKGAFPEVCGARFTDEFPAMVMRKLFLLNCAQAAAAYLGFREGCQYVHEAAAHRQVAPVVRAALAEAKAALKADSPHQAEAIEREAAEALDRIANAKLADTISRVARGPRRKLSPRERLVGPARLAQHHHLPNSNLCRVIAATLTYNDPGDGQALAMQEAIMNEGLEKVLTEDCGLLPHEELARTVKQQWLRLVANPAGDQSQVVWMVGQTKASLDDILHGLAQDLNRRYDSTLVKDVLARVAEGFQSARVWSYLPA